MQVGRQVLTIVNSPNEAMVASQGSVPQQAMGNLFAMDPQMSQPYPSDVATASSMMNSPSASRHASLYSQGPAQEAKSDRDQLLGSIDLLNKPLGMGEFSSGKYEQMHVNLNKISQ
uniref:Uncharacterized protein n=1 Tax=Spongospora subterranea TaxID=70186 RepID=A0A0H5RBF0_9EUKA|eukprot:CRZ11540.1 hypothetical protein [Spongospora subterranea]